jgi:DNA repair protein RecN (Recombination protein N)
MLALKRILARMERLPIMVFDEIDTGISGAVAAKVGRSLKELARFHQVIVITHLPQIACQADQHYRVEKVLRSGRAVTQLRALDEEERSYEIARLLSGDAVTEKALESARELLAAARC